MKISLTEMISNTRDAQMLQMRREIGPAFTTVENSSGARLSTSSPPNWALGGVAGGSGSAWQRQLWRRQPHKTPFPLWYSLRYNLQSSPHLSGSRSSFNWKQTSKNKLNRSVPILRHVFVRPLSVLGLLSFLKLNEFNEALQVSARLGFVLRSVGQAERYVVADIPLSEGNIKEA